MLTEKGGIFTNAKSESKNGRTRNALSLFEVPALSSVSKAFRSQGKARHRSLLVSVVTYLTKMLTLTQVEATLTTSAPLC